MLQAVRATLRPRDTINFVEQAIKLELVLDQQALHSPPETTAVMQVVQSTLLQQRHFESDPEHKPVAEEIARDSVSDEDELDDEDDLDAPLEKPAAPVFIASQPLKGTPTIEETEDDGKGGNFSSGHKPKPRHPITYGSRGKGALRLNSPIKAKGAASEISNDDEDSVAAADVEMSNVDGDDEPVEVELEEYEQAEQLVSPTSEVTSPKVAQEAASRSVSRGPPHFDTAREASPATSGKLPSASKKGIKRKLGRRSKSPYDVTDDAPYDVTKAEEKPKKRCRPSKTVLMNRDAEVDTINSPAPEQDNTADTEQLEEEPPKKRGRSHQTMVTEPRQDEVAVAQSTLKDTKLPKAALPEEIQDEIVVAPSSVTKKSTRHSNAASSSPVKPSLATKTPAHKSSPKKVSVARSSSLASTALSGRVPKVLLSSSTLSVKDKTWLKKHAKIEEDTPSKRTHFICVVRDENVPSTVKVLKTLLANKMVVGDSWVTDSKKEGTLLELEDYMHPDLEGNIANKARQTIFTGKVLYFTRQASSSYGNDWNHILQISADAGARAVETGSAITGHFLQPQEHVIFFGLDDERDNDAVSLIRDHGRHVYVRSLLAQSVIRAELDLESEEFRLSLPLTPGKVKGTSKK